MTGWKERGGPSLARALEAAYARGEDDYHMPALVALNEAGQPVGKVRDGDTVVFCCRRGEREIELTEMFTEKGFSAVERTWRNDLTFILMTLYHEKFAHLPVAFAPEQLHNTLAQAVSEAGKTQFHCAESEKFAHITFFLNGGNNTPCPGETDLHIPSPKGKPDVAHTCNPVPCVLITPENAPLTLREDCCLASVSPTLLQLMGIPAPADMTAPSLLTEPISSGRPVMLIVLDGWGVGAEDDTNPIFLGDTEPWASLMAAHPHTLLHAHGLHVGPGAKKAGNSEAGHMNLGAGRIFPQDDQRLEKAMQDGSYEQNKVFLNAIEETRRKGKALHLLSYLTHKSSHGSIDYAVKLCAMAKDLPEVYLHIILDGRSTENGSAPQLLMELEEKLQAIGAGVIVDCIGRGNVLDRDFNYAKVKMGYDAMVDGVGEPYLLSL